MHEFYDTILLPSDACNKETKKTKTSSIFKMYNHNMQAYNKFKHQPLNLKHMYSLTALPFENMK